MMNLKLSLVVTLFGSSHAGYCNWYVIMFPSIYIRVATLNTLISHFFITHLLLFSSSSLLLCLIKGETMVQEQAQHATALIRVEVGVMSAKLTVRKVVKVDGALMMAILHLLRLLHLLLRH